jgi:hypothetical protein
MLHILIKKHLYKKTNMQKNHYEIYIRSNYC